MTMQETTLLCRYFFSGKPHEDDEISQAFSHNTPAIHTHLKHLTSLNNTLFVSISLMIHVIVNLVCPIIIN